MNWKNSALVLVLLVALPSCGHYSFTGVNLDAKTISIDDFLNNTDLGPANLGQTFTNSLKDYFLQNSALSIVQTNGELRLEGVITGFAISQVAPTASGQQNGVNAAALSRLTITVKASYDNSRDESLSFKDRSFSFYADFDNSQNLTDVQDRLIRDIFDQLIQNIFNASIANW